MADDAVLAYLKAFRDHDNAAKKAADLVAKVRKAAEATKDWQTRLTSAGGLQFDRATGANDMAALPKVSEVEAALVAWKSSLEKLQRHWDLIAEADRVGLGPPPSPRPG
jgi:tryptophan 2,3-dioxygenase